MTEKEARSILVKMGKNMGFTETSTRLPCMLFSETESDSEATDLPCYGLDGSFSVRELKAIAYWFEKYGRE